MLTLRSSCWNFVNTAGQARCFDANWLDQSRSIASGDWSPTQSTLAETVWFRWASSEYLNDFKCVLIIVNLDLGIDLKVPVGRVVQKICQRKFAGEDIRFGIQELWSAPRYSMVFNVHRISGSRTKSKCIIPCCIFFKALTAQLPIQQKLRLTEAGIPQFLFKDGVRIR